MGKRVGVLCSHFHQSFCLRQHPTQTSSSNFTNEASNILDWLASMHFLCVRLLLDTMMMIRFDSIRFWWCRGDKAHVVLCLVVNASHWDLLHLSLAPSLHRSLVISLFLLHQKQCVTPWGFDDASKQASKQANKQTTIRWWIHHFIRTWIFALERAPRFYFEWFLILDKSTSEWASDARRIVFCFGSKRRSLAFGRRRWRRRRPRLVLFGITCYALDDDADGVMKSLMADGCS